MKRSKLIHSSLWPSPTTATFMKNSKMRQLRSDVQATLKRLNGMLGVKAGRGWINWLLKVSYSLRGGMTAGIARSAVVCIRHFYAIYKSQGVKGLVLRTKSLYVLTMQAHGGYIQNSQALGPAISRTGSGLPRVIPREHRLKIRAGEVFYLRLYLSWFSIYRVLTYPSKIKLNTITDPGVYLSNNLIKEILQLIPKFVSQFGFSKPGDAIASLGEVSFTTLSKSTPSFSTRGRKMSSSPLGILAGAWSLVQNKDVFASWLALAEILDFKGPFAGLGWTKSLLKVMAKFQNSFGDPRLAAKKTTYPTGYCGKLGFKDEAAGKVRVFAMVECWTQWLLRPLHLFIFKMLAKLPCDGTNDQFAPIQRLLDLGKTKFWCYDLSAATDRLPIAVQSRILSYLFGESFGPHWAYLLIGRDYHVPVSDRTAGLPASVRYSVGQPMGALSSWAMLALTHHFIVQWAAFRVGKPFGKFLDYAVLGDDVVIADGKVANAYLQIMETLGVGVGLHKSLVSKRGVLEFAKKYIVRGQDASPVPFKEMAAALCDFEYSTEFVLKYKLGLSSIVGFLGYGYRIRGRLTSTFDTLPRKLATLGKWRASPWGPLAHNVASWLNINSYIIRPQWLVQVTEMWPELPEMASKAVIDAAKADEKRNEKVREVLPLAGKSYSRSRWLTDWMENKLFDIAKVVVRQLFVSGGNPAQCYDGLFAIQHEILLATLSPLRKDLSELGDTLFSITRHSRPTLPEHLFLKWMKSRYDIEQVRKPALIGEHRKLAAKPSPLYAARLWHSLKGLPKIKPSMIAKKPIKKSKSVKSKETPKK